MLELKNRFILREGEYTATLTRYIMDKSMRLPLVLGKKLNGEDLIVDLTKLPHLLISVLTGFGKSNLIINIVDELAARITISINVPIVVILWTIAN